MVSRNFPVGDLCTQPPPPACYATGSYRQCSVFRTYFVLFCLLCPLPACYSTVSYRPNSWLTLYCSALSVSIISGSWSLLTLRSATLYDTCPEFDACPMHTPSYLYLWLTLYCSAPSVFIISKLSGSWSLLALRFCHTVWHMPWIWCLSNAYSKLLVFLTYFVLFCPKCFYDIKVIWFLIPSCLEISHTVWHLTYTFLNCALSTAVSYC